jgi:hypothetical protein
VLESGKRKKESSSARKETEKAMRQNKQLKKK